MEYIKTIVMRDGNNKNILIHGGEAFTIEKTTDGLFKVRGTIMTNPEFMKSRESAENYILSIVN